MLPVPSTTPFSANQPCANLNAYVPSATTIPEFRVRLGGAAWGEQLRITYRKGSQTHLGRRTSADLGLGGEAGLEAEQCQPQASHCCHQAASC